MDQPLEHELLHSLKNQIAIALSFCDLMLDESEERDPRRDDLTQIKDALTKALGMMPAIASQIREP